MYSENFSKCRKAKKVKPSGVIPCRDNLHSSHGVFSLCKNGFSLFKKDNGYAFKYDNVIYQYIFYIYTDIISYIYGILSYNPLFKLNMF